MSSFLFIIDSKKNKEATNQNKGKIYEFLEEELTAVGYNVLIKKFTFDDKLPIITEINKNPIDYIIIDVPKRLELSELLQLLVIQKENINELLIKRGVTQRLIDKKIKLPYIILFPEKESIDIKVSDIPVFIEDIILKNSNPNLIFAKLAILIKRHSIDNFNKFRTEKLVKIFNKSNVIIMELDENFEVKFINKKGLSFFGTDVDNIINNNYFDLLTKDEDYKKTIKYIFNYNITNNNTRISFETKSPLPSSDTIINWIAEITLSKNGVEDAILVGYETPKRTGISDKIEKIASSLANENKKLLQQLEVSKKSSEILQKEMNLARKIQHGIIPREFPPLTNAEISAIYVPMDAVGGDFYDVFKFENSFGVIIADVVGHGIPAALVTSMTKVLSHTLSRRIFSPKVFTASINNELNKLLLPGNFLTLFVLHYDNSTNIIKFASGGHLPQILYRKETHSVHLLQSTGPVIGIIPDSEYGEKTITDIKKGDRLIIFTDGITEAKNKKRELYGMDRLILSIKRHANKNIEDFKNALLDDIAIFAKGVKVDDDVSVIIVGFTGG